MAVLKLLVILLIFVVHPFGQVGKIDVSSFSFTFFDAGVALLIFYWFTYSLFTKKKIEGELKKPIIIFVITGALSLLVNGSNFLPSQLLVAVSYLFRFILFASIYFVFKSFDKSFNIKIIKYFFFSGVIVLIIGYLQFLFYPNLRNLYYLGWDEHLYRLFSTFLDPNFAGIYFVIIFFTGIYLFKKEKHITYLFFLPFIFAGTFLTYSRTALVFLIVSLFTFLTITGQKKFFIVFIFLIIIAIVFAPKSFKTEGTNLFRTTSINERITSMNRGLLIFADHPLFGVGFNNYRFAQENYGFIDEDILNLVPNRAGAGVENSYMFVLATEGIIGFAAYLYFLFRIAKIYIKNRTDLYSQVMFAVLMGLFVSAFFINSLFYTFFMFWMFMTAGIIESK